MVAKVGKKVFAFLGRAEVGEDYRISLKLPAARRSRSCSTGSRRATGRSPKTLVRELDARGG